MNKQSYSMFDEEHVAPHIYKLLSNFIKEVPDLESLIQGNGIEKLNILTLTAEQRIELEEKISQLGNVAFASSFPISANRNGNLEMTEATATKGFAVKGLADSLGMGKANIMCFGDGENDMQMLQLVGHGVAMGNAVSKLKEVAKEHTESVLEDGIANYFEKNGLCL